MQTLPNTAFILAKYKHLAVIDFCSAFHLAVAMNDFIPRLDYEIVKDEATPPPPTAQDYAEWPTTPSDVGNGPEYRDWVRENRPPGQGGRERSPSAAEESIHEEEEDDDEDNEWGSGVEDEAWLDFNPLTTPSGSRETSPVSIKRDASHFSPQKDSAPPKKRKGTPRGRPMDERYKKELSSTILKLPPNLPAIRDAVFALGTTVTWTPAQFDAY